MKEKFSTYSVIPTEIMLSNDLSSTAKILYGVISSLTNEKGYCWASNDYLGSLLNISSKTASLLIKELSDYGYIQSNVEKNYKRKIFLGGITKMFRGYNKNVKGVLQKCKDNNIKEYYKDNINNSKQSLPVNDILNEFYEFNPTLNFGNKTQRSATEELLKKYGLEQLKVMIKQYRVIMSNKFCPIGTTPIAYKNKLGDIIAFINKEKSNLRFIDLDE